ncbi:MAG: gliding motility-associated C-terminal domain-containing protein [Bacteroidia bacterium]|nr:gliding motility-associated C-terminal domain-containing protein [Bacteroidia bacterium]MCZ2249203.1 gliding motility-associated C-terminal domain-containing protein [Bacteroidia bacterium]
MEKKIIFILGILFSVFACKIYAQNTLITSEDFESGTYITTLNDTGIAANTGSNKWIINNSYSGNGLYPNTISQDSTVGGLITHPNSQYLHIYDSVSAANNGVSNAIYNPQNASDRFTVVKQFCTLGFSGVTVAYYYLCKGDSTNAYGQTYYSINNGAWTPFPGAVYRNTNKWKYTELIDPVFDNKSNVRIGFRWTNNSTNSNIKTSFAIDDIRVVGNFDVNMVGITIDSLKQVPVCQNFNFLAYFSLSNPLCGSGFYQIELSNASGNFNNPTSLGIYQLNNLNIHPVLSLNIPASTPPGVCYKIRITRIDVTPNVVSMVSNCFEVLHCGNTVTTLEPVMLSNPLDTICVGSVIDIPFFSTGVFVNNTYVAQLSDSAGNFPPNPNVLGTFPNSNTYDPALGSLPGNVSGLLSPLFHPIPPGCNYYIRVISINPSAIGSVYGPFCIRNCDILTNDHQDIKACITTTTGYDTTCTIQVHQYDSNAVYNPGNEFKLQLLSSMTFSVVNTGGLGSIEATGDTIMPVSIPDLNGLMALGLMPGLYYARIIATNSSNMWNSLGTLIRVVIGAPEDVPLGVYAYNPTNFTGFIPVGDSTICLGSAIYFTMLPYNSNSSYVWTLNNQTNWSTDQYTGVLFNQTGNFYMSVVETNYGCVGPGSDTAKITVIGPPSVTVSGPNQVCVGDTATFNGILQNNTYYHWSTSNNGQIIDTLNNITNIYFPNTGSVPVYLHAVNSCGVANGTKNIMVRPLPTVDAGNDTTICPGIPFTLSTPAGSNYNYYWMVNDSTFATTQETFVIPDQTTTYTIKVTSFGALACKGQDSITISLKAPGSSSYTDSTICEGDLIRLDPGSGINYVWNTGFEGQILEVNQPGTYVVVYNESAGICSSKDTFNIQTKYCEEPLPDSLFVPNVFTVNGDGLNDKFRIFNTNYQSLEVVIYNRWGQKVGYWNGIDGGWDGTHIDSGKNCPDGVYFYVGNAQSKNNIPPKEIHGTVTLIRK